MEAFVDAINADAASINEFPSKLEANSEKPGKKSRLQIEIN